MQYEIEPSVPGQWYISEKGNHTNSPIALFYDLDAATAFVAAHNAGAQKPVAWQFRELGADHWVACPEKPTHLSDRDFEKRPLYTQPQPITEVARDVLAERYRQVEVEGFSSTHDAKQIPGDLARAAACYAMHAAGVHTASTHPPSIWPRNWSVRWWKPDVSRRDLVKSGALILAEIERLDRAKGE